ncbi:hypothetical protein F2P81_020595 [Scophthalmus maximus]|uniref:Uncharacterized protein n=1 Tax=Scophthalmus maximus TaxID=52904 RepID=A0A6A4SAQ0_SCOMX|nr:hypothetical protein F2P81_020595 [Scophthalmus maximus]
MHRKKLEHDTYVLGTIHPFRKTHRSVFGKLRQEFQLVTSDRRVKVPNVSKQSVYHVCSDMIFSVRLWHHRYIFQTS